MVDMAPVNRSIVGLMLDEMGYNYSNISLSFGCFGNIIPYWCFVNPFPFQTRATASKWISKPSAHDSDTYDVLWSLSCVRSGDKLTYRYGIKSRVWTMNADCLVWDNTVHGVELIGLFDLTREIFVPIKYLRIIRNITFENTYTGSAIKIQKAFRRWRHRRYTACITIQRAVKKYLYCPGHQFERKLKAHFLSLS